MRHSWSVPVLLALAALAGYAAGTRPVQAQSELWPVSNGEVVTLTFAGSGTRSSSIEEIKGRLRGAGLPNGSHLASGSVSARRSGVNLAQVEWVTKPRPSR
jgi:hypothetical protein